MFTKIKNDLNNLKLGSIKNSFDSFIRDVGAFSVFNTLGMNTPTYSNKHYLEAYETGLYLNRGLNKRAEKVAEIEFEMMKGEGEVEHPFLEVLEKPNNFQTGFDFRKIYQNYMDIYGFVCIEIINKKQGFKELKEDKMQLIHLNPASCTLYFNSDGSLSYVELGGNGANKRKIDAKNILYIHNPAPSNPSMPESLISSGMLQVLGLNDIYTYQSSVIKNGGKVEGILKFDTDNINPQESKRMSEEWQIKHAEAKKYGRPMFVPNGVEYTNMGLSPTELSFNESKQALIDDMVSLTGVPKVLLSRTSGETFSNAEQAVRVFLQEVINPLDRKLVTALNDDRFFDTSIYELTYKDPVPENREELRKDLETAHKIASFTTDEKREALGKDPLPDGIGESVMIAQNFVELGKEPEPETEPEQPEEEEVEEEDEEDKKKENEVKNSVSNNPMTNKIFRTIYHQNRMNELESNTKKVMNKLIPFFKEQERKVLQRFKLESGYKHFRIKNNMDNAFNMALEIRLAKDTLLPILKELLIEAGESGKDIAGSDYEFNMTAEMNSWLEVKLDIFAKSINNTTFDKLKDEFIESLKNNEGRDQLIDRIKNVYDGIEDWRAETIARTEIHGVTNYGTYQGYSQAGLTDKVWVWSPGIKGGVRDNHLAIDGERVPINQPFSNGLLYPGDPVGGASNNVNCQCFI